MSWKACLDEIQKAAGRQLTDDEMESLLEEFQKRIAQRKLLGPIDDMDRAIREEADNYAKDVRNNAMIQKRNAALQLKARLSAVDFISTQFADNPALGLEAVLVGVNRPGLGTRLSVAAEQNQLTNKYVGGFIADVETAGLWREFVSGQFDRDIARALWARNRDEPFPVDAPKEAIDIADIVAKWQDVVRQEANEAGAYINRMPGYIVRQSHDLFKIQRAGYEAWKAEILPRLDPRTFDGVTDTDGFLRAAYDGLASGVHLKAPGETTGVPKTSSIAKKMSAERVLHFKSGDDWFAYNQVFGTRSLREALIHGFQISAQNTGLMRRMGPNPRDNFNRIVDEITRKIDDPEAKRKFQEASRGYLSQRMSVVDGSARHPVNAMGARVGGVVRALEGMAKLGGAVLSAFSDIGLYASEMRYQGKGYLSGVGEAIQGLAKGRNRKEMAEIDGMIGVAMDGLSGEMTSRFSIAQDDIPGTLSKMQQSFFKWNGLTWWTDTMRATAVRSMSHRLALNVGNAFEALDPDLTRTLGLYGIDADRWNVIRQATTKEADGRAYLTTEGIEALDDSVVAPLVAKPTPTAIRKVKRELADQVRAYFVDRSEYAVITPDQRTRAIMQRGTRPGTVEGEFLRFIGQFKSFPLAVIQKSMGREVYGRGAKSLTEAMRNGNGEMLGLAKMILLTTAFGYAAMTAKDVFKGRTPRDPLDQRTWAAAMVQGGGAGIYGDFLFGELRTRFGGGPIATALGPTVGTAEQILDVIGRMRAGDDPSAAAFRTLVSNTPFLNLFYTRAALDYLILYQIQEALSPGSLRRLEQRVEKENAQTFLLRPSEFAR